MATTLLRGCCIGAALFAAAAYGQLPDRPQAGGDNDATAPHSVQAGGASSSGPAPDSTRAEPREGGSEPGRERAANRSRVEAGSGESTATDSPTADRARGSRNDASPPGGSAVVHPKEP